MTGTHVKIGLLTLCLALLLGVPAVWLSKARVTPERETVVAVEHTAPATLRIEHLASSGANVFEIGFSGTGTIALHLPGAWRRQEVSGAPLASVTSEPQDWNYNRWTLPTNATVRFDAPDPGSITLMNPSGIPLTVRVTTVNALTGERDDDAVIMTVDPYVLP